MLPAHDRVQARERSLRTTTPSLPQMSMNAIAPPEELRVIESMKMILSQPSSCRAAARLRTRLSPFGRRGLPASRLWLALTASAPPAGEYGRGQAHGHGPAASGRAHHFGRDRRNRAVWNTNYLKILTQQKVLTGAQPFALRTDSSPVDQGSFQEHGFHLRTSSSGECRMRAEQAREVHNAHRSVYCVRTRFGTAGSWCTSCCCRPVGPA